MTVANIAAFSDPVTVVDGVNTYTYSFDAYDASHVQVQHTEADGTINFLTYDTDYTVVPVAEPGVGGTVTVTATLTVGDQIVLFRDTSLAQETNLPNQGPFFAETVEREFDRVAMLAQESARDVALAVRFPIGTDANAEFPVPVEGKSVVGRMVNGVLTYKADGLSDVDITAAASAATAEAEGYATAASADAAQTALDRIATAADVVSTAADVVSTNADVVQTALDRIATAADVVSTDAAAASVGLNALGLGAAVFDHLGVGWPGYLEADGSTFDETVYPDLYARYGDSNVLPDFRDRVPRGAGTLAGLAGTTQEDAIENIVGTMGSFLTPNSVDLNTGVFSSKTNTSTGASGGGAYPFSTVDFDASTVVNTATETRVKAVVGKWYIKAYGAILDEGTADLAAMETSINAAVSFNAQTKTDAAKLQARTNIGARGNNVVMTHDIVAAAYAAATTRELVTLETDITTQADGNKVKISARILHSSPSDGAFYVERDGVEIGSCAAAGSRTVGITPTTYDSDLTSTPQTTAFEYLDTVPLAGDHTYTFHWRGPSQIFQMNRSGNDTDSAAFERGTSTVIIEEIGA